MIIERYTVRQCVCIIKSYYDNGKVLLTAVCKEREIFVGNIGPNPSTVRRIVERLRIQVIDVKHSTQNRVHQQSHTH